MKRKEVGQLYSRPAGPGLILCLVFSLLCVSAAFARSDSEQVLSDLKKALAERVDAERYASFEDPANELFSAKRLAVLLKSSDEAFARNLDKVIKIEYTIPLGRREHLKVYEAFTLRSWLARQRRAILFLNGSVFVGNNFSIPVEGYDTMAIAARRGMFAFAFDYLGTGGSYLPVQGTEADFAENTAAAYTVVWFIKTRRHVRQVDLYGEGYGGAIATQLAADRRSIRSCVMSAMLYSDLAGGPLSDPQFIELLEQDPDGYIFMPDESYLIFAGQSPPAAQAYLQSTQAGFYPTPNLLVVAHLPFYDPGVARVPGLAIYGQLDTVGGPNDATDLAASYGTEGAELIVLEGAGHAPRTESPEVTERFWDLVLDFIDR